MAIIEFALRSHLAADAAIAAKVSGRIYPLVIPQDASSEADKLTYRRKMGPRDGNLAGGIDVATAAFEIVAWSRSYDSAKLLAEDVRQAMHGVRQGQFGSGGGAVQVGSVTLVDEEDGYYDPEDGSDSGWFSVVLEYRIRYVEAAP